MPPDHLPDHHLTTRRIHKPAVEKAFRRYLAAREEAYGHAATKPVNLMDMATMGGKALKKARGYLGNLDESEEINACSIKINVDVDGKQVRCSCSRTRPITIRRRSSRSVVQPLLYYRRRHP